MKRYTEILLILLCLVISVFSPEVSAQTVDRHVTIVKSIELRNYVLQPGMQAKFATFMDHIIIPRQTMLGASLLNAYRLKDSVDNYVWLRGFADMPARSQFMKDFYYSDYWNQHRTETNSMLIDSYNVHLLKPLIIKGESIDTISGIRADAFGKQSGITVATYYVTQTARQQLIDLFVKQYAALLHKSGVHTIQYLIAESAYNDYKPQHAYQGKNLLITLMYFDSEESYANVQRAITSSTDPVLQRKLESLITSVSTQILYPLNKN